MAQFETSEKDKSEVGLTYLVQKEAQPSSQNEVYELKYNVKPPPEPPLRGAFSFLPKRSISSNKLGSLFKKRISSGVGLRRAASSADLHQTTPTN